MRERERKTVCDPGKLDCMPFTIVPTGTFVLGQRTLLIRENFSCWNQTGACVPELIMPSGHDIAMELTFGARAQRSSLGSFGARA